MNSLDLVIGAIICASGVRLALYPKGREQLKREREARIAKIASGSPERFFEEKRSLEAYPISTWVPKSQRSVRIVGVIVLALGVLIIGRGVLLPA